jgi:hypothetical protein
MFSLFSKKLKQTPAQKLADLLNLNQSLAETLYELHDNPFFIQLINEADIELIQEMWKNKEFVHFIKTIMKKLNINEQLLENILIKEYSVRQLIEKPYIVNGTYSKLEIRKRLQQSNLFSQEELNHFSNLIYDTTCSDVIKNNAEVTVVKQVDTQFDTLVKTNAKLEKEVNEYYEEKMKLGNKVTELLNQLEHYQDVIIEYIDFSQMSEYQKMLHMKRKCKEQCKVYEKFKLDNKKSKNKSKSSTKPRKKRTKVTDSLINDVKVLKEEGYTHASISEQLEIGLSTVSNILKK